MPVAMPMRTLSGLLRARVELRDGGGDVETSPDRPLGVLLVGAREAEIGQHAIAHEFGDEAVIACDRARTGVLIGAMTLRMSSGSSRADSAVEPTRSENMTVSWRRSAASATGGSGCGGWGRGRGTSERRDGLQ